MSQSLLEVRNLRTYLKAGARQVKAVDDISFNIPKGETFCLVGESGSGKSVSALSVIRLLPEGVATHPSGEIIFNDQDLLKLDDAGIRAVRGSQIAMIFQEPMTSLNPVLSIGEQITEALYAHRPDISDSEAEQRTIKALEQVQIAHAIRRFHDYPHQLSGGQRQRVMIAMALACEPQLLIADEPTTALDVTVQAEILRLMRQIQDDTGMSMLFITHDFGVVAQMAQWVGVMQQGQLVESGSCASVLHKPQHAYTQQLLAALPENLVKPKLHAAFEQKSPATPLLSIRDLKVWFPINKGLLRRTVDYVRAVDQVSLDIFPGQIVALVGESGCGKTTLGRAVLQLEPPTSGSIKFRDQELIGLSARTLGFHE